MGLKKLFFGVGAIVGYIFGIIGTIVTILSVSGQITIDIKWTIILGLFVIFLIVLTIKATVNYANIVRNGTRFAITTYSKDAEKDYYYTSYSQNLRVGTLVTVYYSKPMSKKMGYGIIHNSSVEEYIEVEMLFIEPAMHDIFEQSKTNNGKVLEDMYILANVYVENIPQIASLLSGGTENNG